MPRTLLSAAKVKSIRESRALTQRPGREAHGLAARSVMGEAGMAEHGRSRVYTLAAVSHLVANVAGGEHRPLAGAKRAGPQSFFDPPLASQPLLSCSGVHSKRLLAG